MLKRWKCTVCGQVFVGDRPPDPCPVCGADEDAFVLLPDAVESTFRRDTLDRFVIIGGGAAGFEAAKAIRARNNTATVRLIAGEGLLPYNRPQLSDALADGLSFDNMVLEPYAFFGLNNIELITAASATTVDPSAQEVTLSDGRKLGYDKLLLATGANPFNPLPRTEDAIPCFTLRGYRDVLDIEAQCRGKRAIVVGGGILGLEAALALRERGATVCVFELGERALPLQADTRASAILTRALESQGISIRTVISVKRFIPGGAELTDGAIVDADFALASIGVRSEVSLAKAMGLDVGRGIVVDAFMRTSAPGAFAAGDCAEYQGRVAGLWAAAVAQGQIAGASMCGDQQMPYEPIVPATAFEVGGVQLFSAGTLQGKAHMTHESELTGAYRRLYFQDGKLCGAVFVGDVSGSAKVMEMIASGARPEEARRAL